MKKLILLSIAIIAVAGLAFRVELVAKEPDPAEQVDLARQNAEQPDDQDLGVPLAPPPAVTFTTHQFTGEVVTAESREAEEAEKELVEAGERGFTAARAAYDTDTITLDLVCDWSIRWLTAAELVADNPGEKLAATQANLERLQKLQIHIKRLFEVGARGGEAEKMAMIDYYVADAKRRVAHAKRDGELTTRNAQRSRDKMNELDLELQQLTLRADAVQRAERNLQVAHARFSKAHSDLKVAAASGYEKNKAEAEKTYQEAFEIVRSSEVELTAARATYTGALKKAEWAKHQAPAAARPAAADDEDPALRAAKDRAREEIEKQTPSSPPKEAANVGKYITELRKESNRKVALRYDGRGFSEWKTQIQTELSHDKLLEACKAFAAFAKAGYGAEAAALIVDVGTQHTRNALMDNATDRLVLGAEDILLSLPIEDVLPSLTTALKSDKETYRYFAVRVLARFGPAAQPLDAEILKLLADPNQQVRIYAASALGSLKVKEEDLAAALRQMFADDDEQKLSLAASMVYGLRMKAEDTGMVEFVPDLIKLLDHSSDKVQVTAVQSLAHFGADAAPALPKILPWLKSENGDKQSNAMNFIHALGPAAASATPALIELIDGYPFRLACDPQPGPYRTGGENGRACFDEGDPWTRLFDQQFGNRRARADRTGRQRRDSALGRTSQESGGALCRETGNSIHSRRKTSFRFRERVRRFPALANLLSNLQEGGALLLNSAVVSAGKLRRCRQLLLCQARGD